jgi:hypothetical protein
MSTQGSPAGWHPDPAAPGQSVRWWDGTQWTDHTQPVAPAPPPVLPPPGVGVPPAHLPPAPPLPGGSGLPSVPTFSQTPVQQTFAQANSMSLSAVGVAAVYVLLALVTHFVLLGIVPLLLAVRALRAKERLAPVAIAAAAVVVVVSVIALTHH